MPSLKFKLEAVSPVFLNGADPKGLPEFRASSVRGQLRYWLRAIIGADTSDLRQLHNRESEIFGSTKNGSVVSVRFFGQDFQPSNTEMLPHRIGSDKNPSRALSIPAGTSCDLSFVMRPGVEFPELLSKAFSTWLLLGGIGKRSRRMFGGFRIVNVDRSPTLAIDSIADRAWWTRQLKTPQSLLKLIPDHMGWLFPQSAILVNTPPTFPTLHPQHSRIVVGMRPFDSAKAVNMAFFREILRNDALPFRQNEQMFGYAKSQERRASPLIAQVKRIGNQFYPIWTVMRSPLVRPDHQPTDWKLVDALLDEAERQFDGTTVWGGKF